MHINLFIPALYGGKKSNSNGIKGLNSRVETITLLKHRFKSVQILIVQLLFGMIDKSNTLENEIYQY